MKEWAVAVDIGGSKIEVALVDREGHIGLRKRWATDIRKDIATIEADVVNAVREFEKAGDMRLIGVGVGVAGQIDPQLGLIHFSPNLQWHNVPLVADLKRALGLPVALLSDVQSATLAEWKSGAGRGCRDLVCLCVGTGIGGGIVANGQLMRGSSGIAGEFGHMTVELNGARCSCGNRGCLEAVASGWAIALRARELIVTSPERGCVLLQLADGIVDNVTARTVAEAVHLGDPAAVGIMDGVVDALIAGCASIVNALNPKRLLLGGGVLQGHDELIQRIANGIPSRALKTGIQEFEVMPLAFGGDAVLVGASQLVFP